MLKEKDNPIVATVPTRAERETAEFLSVPPPASLFQGTDSVNGSGLSTAVDGSYATHGGTSRVFYQVAMDLDTLYQALDVSQSVSVGFGPIGGVDEKSEFVQRLSLTTYSVNIVVRATHVMGTNTATAFKLKSGINPPSGNTQLRDFFRSYGDAFVSSLTTGSEYYAVYTFYAQSKEEQESVSIELKHHGIFEFGSVDTDLQTKLNKVTTSTQVRLSFNQNVSGIANPKLPTTDDMIAYALAFPSLPIDAPAILAFAVTGYEHVPDMSSFAPVAKNREFLIGPNGDSGLSQYLVAETELLNQIAWLKKIYAFYQGFQDGKVDEVQHEAQADLDALNEQFMLYESDPTAALTKPALPSLDRGTPMLEYGTDQSPARGGNGGSPFNDVDINTYIQNQTYVSDVTLRTGSEVDALIVTYVATAKATSTKTYHGGGGGKATQTLQIRQGQFIKGLSGRSGSRVDQLRITLDDGRSVGGGGGGGSPFEWQVPPGSVVLGFAGRSGSRLDQVEAVYATLRSASWKK
ncbi:hypothetical protein WK92_06040 [Burkholderia ubonensis]|uniref:jacalin-like lectin n=1 Tax=Burkholderia ubonensis TaxID=101571 RepID=UPI000759BC27|nr:hypothetical protein [Burkholderia ubonensis]KVG23013.1 hypothetical protein WJ29_09920 [Burkholderia ubonensis]KVV42896.1 hypothetical protein WK82_20805 [Burkholderia ubonensis]KVW26068.1 hypothetical protein WK92_06040 [Burkholderia ubonensis]OJA66591.1 hypothetical protein BGV70_14915 [Burkholderia ubonensis]